MYEDIQTDAMNSKIYTQTSTTPLSARHSLVHGHR